MLIGGFQPFTLSDFPGGSAAIIFTQGCNFKCPYCHNRSLWEMSQPHPPEMQEPDIFSFLKRRIGRLEGIVITGGEPTLHPDLPATIRKIRSMNFKVKLDTNGSNPDMIAELIEKKEIDYIAMDIKAPLEKYDQLCGLAVDTNKICRSLETIAKSEISHHFRTTYYQKLLTDNDLKTIKDFLPGGSKLAIQTFREPK